MRKARSEDILPEYDFSRGVRGKYLERLKRGSNVVVLDQDVASIFPDSKAVNQALRALAIAIRSVSASPSRAGARRAARPKRPARRRVAA